MLDGEGSFLTEPAEDNLNQSKSSRKSGGIVERAGLICVIVVVVVIMAMEAYANSKFRGAYSTLTEQLAAAERQGTALTAADVQEHIAGYFDGKPIIKEDIPKNELGAKEMHLFEFKTLFRTQRFYVYYGVAGRREEDYPEVLNVTLNKVDPLPDIF